MSDSLARLYNVSDDRMLQYASLVHNLYAPDKQKFQDFAPNVFSDDYHLILDDLINRGYTMHDDSMVVLDQSRGTEALRSTYEQFRTEYNGVRFFIEKAFENDPKIQKKLGIGSLSKELRTYNTLLHFLGQFSVMLRHYQAELKNAGCPEEKIKRFEQLYTKMKADRDALDIMKLTRGDRTRERVSHFNEIWKMAVDISKAARGVYPTGDTAAKFAIPYPEKGSSEEPVDFDDLLDRTAQNSEVNG